MVLGYINYKFCIIIHQGQIINNILKNLFNQGSVLKYDLIYILLLLLNLIFINIRLIIIIIIITVVNIIINNRVKLSI